MSDVSLVIAVALVLLATVLLPIVAVVDMAIKPERAWTITGRSRQNWLAAVIAGTLIGFGIVGAIVAIIYYTGPRRELIEALQRRPPRSRWS